jgi:hypothetical protein
VCALTKDFLQEQDFPEMNLLHAWLYLPLAHLKIRDKMLPGKSCCKEIRESEVRLL